MQIADAPGGVEDHYRRDLADAHRVGEAALGIQEDREVYGFLAQEILYR